MTIKLTYAEVTALKPCSLAKIPFYGRRKYLTAKQALDAGASISDLLWVAGRLGLEKECVQFALECAKSVSHLNTDPRVQRALDATQAWLDNPSQKTADAAWAAARAAWAARAAVEAEAEAAAWAVEAAEAAARAAWAAADAARAAWAARAARAAWAAADAARAAWAAAAADAADAARAAWAAAWAARATDQREIFLKIFG